MSKKKLVKNIGSMSVAVFISRIFGLLRDIIMTYFFGTSYVADAFQVAYQIPNLLRKLFGEGALSAAFVPIYNEIGIKQDKKSQINFALNVLSLLSTFLLVLCLIGIFLAPLIVRVIAPGFDDKTYLLALKLTRIMFPYLFLIGLSSTLISVLNSHNYFFIPGLSSAFLNIGMMGCLGIFIFLNEAPTVESKVVIWAYGVILGGILQTIVNFPILWRIGYTIKINLSLRGKALESVWKRFIPGVIGIAIRQVNLAVDLILASLLATGSIAALSYGNRLMQLPLGVFGVSVGIAVLPLFSKYVAQQKWAELKDSLRFSIITVSYVMLPITAIIVGLGKDFIRIIFMRGAFDITSLNMTYRALLFYSLGLIFFSLNRILIPIFYANKDTKTPVKISAFIVVINILLNIILMHYMQHAGLAFATSISAMIHFAILNYYLKKKYKMLKIPRVSDSILKISFLSLLIFLIIIYANSILEISSFFFIIIKIVSLGIISFILLMVGSHLLKIEYSKDIKNKIWKKFLKR